MLLASGQEVDNIAEDIKRISCQSEYMFLYANDLCEHIIKILTVKLQEEQQDEQGEQERSRRKSKNILWIQKIRRLVQELRKVAITDKREESTHRLDNAAVLAANIVGLTSNAGAGAGGGGGGTGVSRLQTSQFARGEREEVVVGGGGGGSNGGFNLEQRKERLSAELFVMLNAREINQRNIDVIYDLYIGYT